MRSAISTSSALRSSWRSRFVSLLMAFGFMAAVSASAQNTYTVTLFTDTQVGTLQPGNGPGPGVTPSTGGGYDLRGAMFAAMAAGGTSTINFACSAPPCTITLAAPLPPIFETAITGPQAISSFNLTIDGGAEGNIVLDGANLYRVFWVDNVAVNLKNLVIQNALAKGGDGGGGAGGGAGFGAGIFVNQATAVVTVNYVGFQNLAVAGGAGGAGSYADGSGTGSGGGMGFAGSSVAFSGGGGIAGPPFESFGGAGGGGFGSGTISIDPFPPGFPMDEPSRSSSRPAASPADSLAGPGTAYAANSAAVGTTNSGGVAGFGGGGGAPGSVGGVVSTAGGFGGFGGGGSYALPGGFGGGAAVGCSPELMPASVGGITGGEGGYTYGGGGAAAGPAIFVVNGSVNLFNVYASGLTATGGYAPGTVSYPVPVQGTPGTADATPVFNYSGTVNGSTVVGPVATAFPEPVGQTSPTKTATLTFATAVTASNTFSINVLTEGAAGQDFAFVSGGTCASGTAYVAGATCTVQYSFTPKYPGLRMGGITLTSSSAVTAANPNGIVASARINADGLGPQLAFNGNTTNSLGGAFSVVYDTAVDGSGNIYVADGAGLKIMPPGCSSSSCVTSSNAGFVGPHGVAIDGMGNIYVADTYNNAVKEMPSGCNSASCVTTLGASFANPTGVAVNSNGNVYVTTSDSKVLMMTPGCTSSSCVTGLGGGFGQPESIAVDEAGNAYIADAPDSVKEIPAGCLTANCVESLGGGFESPRGVALDTAGHVYVTDATGYLKAMPSNCADSNCVTTLLSGIGFSFGVSLDDAGNLYLVEGESVYEANRAAAVLNFPSLTTMGSTDTTDGTKNLVLSNIGNGRLYFAAAVGSGPNPEVPPDFALASGGSTACSFPASSSAAETLLGVGASCTVPLIFTPKPTSGGVVSESLLFTDNNLNNGNGTVSGNPIPATAGQAVTLTGLATPALTVTDVFPTVGPVSGGTLVTVLGTSFIAGRTTVTLGGVIVPASSVTVTSATSLTFTTPPGSTGTVDIVLSADPAVSAVSVADQFTYVGQPALTQITPSTGPTSGGTTVTLSGLGLANVTAVSFGGIPAVSFTVVGPTEIMAVTPAHAAGAADVAVTGSDGNGTASGAFTYYLGQSYMVTTLTEDDGNGSCVAGAIDNTNGNGSCSLRDALNAANGLNGAPGVINFWSQIPELIAATAASPAVFTVSELATTFRLQGTLGVWGNVVINGPTRGSGASLTNLLALDGTLTLPPGLSLPTNVTLPPGMQVLTNSGTLVLNNLIVRNGYAINIGSFLATNGGGISSSGTLTVNQSTISGNTTALKGGGLAITGGTATILNSTITNNGASDLGAAICAERCQGGGIYVDSAMVAITNSTFYGNFASLAADQCVTGCDGGAVDVNSGTTIVTNSTFVNNSIGTTQCIIGVCTGTNFFVAGGATLDVYNSIIPANPNNSSPSLTNPFYPVQAIGTFVGAHNFSSSSAQDLSPLGNYGGPTQTMALPLGSAAICAGVATISGTSVPSTDQRGVTHSPAYCFPGQVDAGAVQTNYSLAFTTQPPNPVPTNTVMTPAPVVQVQEGGVLYALAPPASVRVTDAASSLLGSKTFVSAGGSATLSGLTFGAGAGSNDLVAQTTLQVVSAGVTTLTARSAQFTINPPVPTVTSILPVGGTTVGGTSVTITGTNFTGVSGVSFGGTPATSFNVVSGTSITAITPAHAVGKVDVVVTNVNVSGTLSSAYTYFAPASFLVTTLTDDAAGIASKCVSGATDNTNGNSACSLRDAITAANVLSGATGTISFWSGITGLSSATSTSPVVYTLLSTPGTLNITGAAVITGPTDSNGNNLIAIDGGHVSGTSGVALITTSGTTSLNKLILRNGYAQIGSAGSGGAVSVLGGTFAANELTLSGNSTSSGGGGALSVNTGAASVTNSTFSGNSSSGGYGGAVNVIGGTVTLSGSTFSTNSTSGGGGGALGVHNGTVVVSNSTFSGNSANGGDGGAVGAASGTLTVLNSTFSGNSVNGGNGSDLAVQSGSATVVNSILADGTSGSFTGSNNITSAAGLNLTALGNYGGPTQTMLPMPGSTALCAGATTISGVTVPSTDQRGASHSSAYCSSGQMDAGAVQTSYGIGFATEPPSSVPASAPMTPSPVVQIEENGLPFATSGVSIRVTATFLSGASANAVTGSGGSASFSNLVFLAGLSPTISIKLVASTTLAGTNASSFITESTEFHITDPLPTVASVSPSMGSTTGGSTVTIYGTGFYDSATVNFGTNSVTGNITTNNSITAVVPAGVSGTVDVTVTTPGGTSPVSSGDKYTYSAGSSYLVTTLTDDGSAASGTYCVAGATDNTNGNSACSLRDAILANNALSGVPDTINFWSGLPGLSTATALNPLVYSLTGASLSITGNVIINGPTSGSGSTLANLLTLDGQQQNFSDIKNTGIATLNNLTVSNGYALTGGGRGGNINSAGTLVLNHVTLFGGFASQGGGGLYVGSGTATVTNSTFYENSTTSFNPTSSLNGGGLYVNAGTVTVTDSTFVGNSAVSGGALASANGATLTVINSTFSGNTASTSGNGLYVAGTTTLSNNILLDSISGSYTNGGGNVTPPTNLGTFGYNGGPTQTILPLPGSNAICAGSAAVVGASSIDQRGSAHSSQYCSTGQMDAGAVQTSYGVSFTTQPANTAVGAVMLPAPVVQIEENNISYSASGVSVTLTDAGAQIAPAGMQGTTGSGGGYSFSGLIFNTVTSSDSLVASIPLNVVPGGTTSTLSASSNSFAVTQVAALSSSFAGNATSVAYGQPIGYQLQVSNTSGSAAISSMSAMVTLPAGLHLASGTGTVCTSALATALNGVITISGINLAASANCQVSFTLTATGLGAQTVSATSSLVGGVSAAGILVTQALPVITWTPSATQLRNGAALSAGVLDGSSTVSGSIAYTATLQPSGTPFAVTSASVLPSGAYQLTATLTPADTTNYTSASATASLMVYGNDIYIAGSGGLGALYNTGGVLKASTSNGGIGAVIDANGNVWSIDSSGGSLAEFTHLGILANDIGSIGLSGATALAVDGNNNLFVANGNGSIVVISTSGSPASTTAGSTAEAPASIAIDTSGNVWVTNTSANTVDEVIGGAAPVTPLANGVQSNTLGVKP